MGRVRLRERGLVKGIKELGLLLVMVKRRLVMSGGLRLFDWFVMFLIVFPMV